MDSVIDIANSRSFTLDTVYTFVTFDSTSKHKYRISKNSNLFFLNIEIYD